jgi:hypothetical protein
VPVSRTWFLNSRKSFCSNFAFTRVSFSRQLENGSGDCLRVAAGRKREMKSDIVTLTATQESLKTDVANAVAAAKSNKTLLD